MEKAEAQNCKKSHIYVVERFAFHDTVGWTTERLLGLQTKFWISNAQSFLRETSGRGTEHNPWWPWKIGCLYKSRDRERKSLVNMNSVQTDVQLKIQTMAFCSRSIVAHCCELSVCSLSTSSFSVMFSCKLQTSDNPVICLLAVYSVFFK